MDTRQGDSARRQASQETVSTRISICKKKTCIIRVSKCSAYTDISLGFSKLGWFELF